MGFQKGHKINLGRPRSQKTKQKISKKLMGHGFTKETLDKISESLKGKVAWNKGIEMSEEYCDSRKEEGNPNWKGGKYKKEGYVFVKVESHPRTTKWGYVPEHILVVEKYLGRYLENGEIVHHVNGIRDDNRLENLEVMRKPEHHWWHQNLDYYKRVINDYLTSVN